MTDGVGADRSHEVVREWLRTFGPMTGPGPVAGSASCPVLDWAASGGMALTGHAEEAPLVSPTPAYRLLAEVCRTLATMTGLAGAEVRADAAEILAGRAGLLGLRRSGRASAGGATRLLRAGDGWCAITLSRQDDLDAVPAILRADAVSDPWTALAEAASRWTPSELAERAQLLGVPGAALPRRPVAGVPWRVRRIAGPANRQRLSGARVVDLSAMWAGPLCARLLGCAGAHVVKVESTHRPDGARRGDPRFFDWLHHGHETVTVDFRSDEGRRVLAGLLDTADVVIEASRPRALAGLGLAPGTRPHRDGQVWLSITGYGRDEPERVAFGDDAAVAGGLVGRDQHGDPVFCADAVADPLSGVCAALAVTGAVLAGGGLLLDLSMCATAAAFATAPAVANAPHPVRRAGDGWVVACPAEGRDQAVLLPRPVAC
jgi:crotonobetainyl-CoA:carnitine CoA-transferase CaiB-like acyl-CoA transferase